MDIPIENCVSARVYKPDTTKKILLISLIVALYAIVFPFAYYTAGEPRQAAIVRAQEIEDEKWTADLSALPDASSDKLENETFVKPLIYGMKKNSDSGITDEEFESLPFQYATVDTPKHAKV